jgi:tRNA pseudouridine13 synthase
MDMGTLPYITPDLPGTGGKLRTKPSHFIVEELPLYEPEGEGHHLYVNLTKEGLTTREVQLRLARLFGLKPHDVGVAGMKDKNARTTQTFSIPAGGFNKGDVARMIKDNIPVAVNWAKPHANKLRLGHLLGNRFTIIISDIGKDSLGKANAIAGQLRRHGLPNYYGPQRFGVEGDNAKRGLEIILGKRKEGPWKRKLLLSSYQSHLCNRYLARRVESGSFSRILEGDVAKKYDTGGLFIVEDVKKEQKRYDSHEISFTAPMYGSKMMEALGQAGKLESEVLGEAGITMEQLGKAKMDGTRRLGRLLVPDIKTEESEDGLVVRFSLPKGAFATTVLREIMKG